MLENSWLFPVIQSTHLAGIALFVGTAVLVDLRILGYGARREASSCGLAVILLTGPILFFANVGRYVSNPAFLFKMAVLTLALAFHFTLHRRQTRVTAIVSMVLWTCVVLGGRAIADFDV